MKRMIFSAAAFGLVAASGMALAPTNAEAIPAFARQTGAACLSCHFQEVPALASFGRAFKEGSFTDVGDQALVEDDNLSIPAVLNATMVVRMNITHTSGGNVTVGVGSPTVPAAAAAPSSTTYGIPVDTNFLVAGRVGAHTGAFVEFGGGVGDTYQAANNIQLMNSWDVGGFKVGLGWADTSFGGDAVMNVSSVYGQHSGAVGDIGGDVGAINNSGFTNSTSAIGAWVGNDLGYIQFALVAPGGAAGWVPATTTTPAASATQNQNGPFVNVGTQMGKLVRAAATFDLAGFDTIIGGGIVTGKVGKGIAGGAAFAQPSDMNLDFVDAQVQGAIGDMTVGVYADWAHAKGTVNGNLYGAQDLIAPNAVAGSTAAALGIGNNLNQCQSFNAWSVRGTLEPAEGITVGVGYGSRKTTDSCTTDTGEILGIVPNDQPKHQVLSAAIAYQLYQNSIISLKYTNDKASGFGPLHPGGNGTTHTTTLDWLTLM